MWTSCAGIGWELGEVAFSRWWEKPNLVPPGLASFLNSVELEMSLNMIKKKGIPWGDAGRPFPARWELLGFWGKSTGMYRAVFSVLRVHQNYLEGSLKHTTQDPTLRFRRSRRGLSTCRFNEITGTAAAAAAPGSQTTHREPVLSRSFLVLLD